MIPLSKLSRSLEKREITSRDLVDRALEKINSPFGEGGRTFLYCNPHKVKAAADAADKRWKHGQAPSPLNGIPISLKDIFDVKGEITTAGSKLLKNSSPANSDAIIVQRLRQAGIVFVGRTNMTEFAYSGIGINTHYGTPKNPFDRKTARIPGGSSSGAAVSVTDGMASAAIGTDTGGSIRIPAALCGLAGFKPTARRIPNFGVYPLCKSLDSVGPLAPSVTCCETIDKILSGDKKIPQQNLSSSRLHIAIPKNYVVDDLEKHVSLAFEKAVIDLSKTGIKISEITLTCLSESHHVNSGGGIYAEAWAVHKQQFNKCGDHYDPLVASRLRKLNGVPITNYLKAMNARKRLIAEANIATNEFDAIILPTTPITAPPIAKILDNEDLYTKTNLRMLKNTFCFNFLDRCALTIPINDPNTAPCGLMVVGETYGDEKLFFVGKIIEKVISQNKE